MRAAGTAGHCLDCTAGSDSLVADFGDKGLGVVFRAFIFLREAMVYLLVR
jgi:hypothetical protein